MRTTLLIAACSGAICSQASAEVVIHSNEPRTFVWMFEHAYMPSTTDEEYLDPTADVSSQTGDPADVSIYYIYNYPVTSSTPASDSIGSYPQSPARTHFAQGQTVTFTHQLQPLWTANVTPLLAMSEGEVVGADLTWVAGGPVNFRWLGSGVSQRLLPDRTFLALKLTIAGATHYGWVELNRQDNNSQPWYPIRWAYETTPNTPVVIPALFEFPPPPSPCPDLNGDGFIGSADLGILLGSWGPQQGPADLNGDGIVNSADLAFILGSWGPCP